jgi:hypothetical protein
MEFGMINKVSQLLGGLLGRQVTVKQGKPGAAWLVVAEYRTDTGTPIGLVVCDGEAATSLAAGLSMIPAAVASSAAKTKKLPENLLENLGEVMNVCGRLVQPDPDQRVQLASMTLSPSPLPPKVKAMMDKPKERADYTVQVAGYSVGALTLFIA